MPDHTKSEEKSKDLEKKESTKKRSKEKLLADLALLGLTGFIPAASTTVAYYDLLTEIDKFIKELRPSDQDQSGYLTDPWARLAVAGSSGILGGLINAGIIGLALLLSKTIRKKSLIDQLEIAGVTDVQRQRELIEEHEAERSKTRLRRALTGAAIGAPIGALGIAAARSGGLLSSKFALGHYAAGTGHGAMAGLLLALLYHTFKGIK